MDVSQILSIEQVNASTWSCGAMGKAHNKHILNVNDLVQDRRRRLSKFRREAQAMNQTANQAIGKQKICKRCSTAMDMSSQVQFCTICNLVSRN